MAQPFKSPSGVYQLRRKVPTELRAMLGREYKRSLKTREPGLAKAKFAEEWARSEEAFALARAQLGGASSLSERDLHQLASRWFRGQLEKMEASSDFTSWLVEGESLGIETAGRYDEHTPYMSVRQARKDDDDPVDFSADIERYAVGTLREVGLPLPADAAVRGRLLAVFRDYWLKLSDIAWQRHRGDWAALPDVLPLAPLTQEANARAAGKRMQLLELFAAYSKDKKLNDGDARGSRKSISDYRAIIAQFVEFFGDLPVGQIDREKVRIPGDLGYASGKG